jgi:hypothetical protein
MFSPFDLIFLDAVPPFCSAEYWRSVAQNSLGCTIGSLVAIGAAYVIYRLTNSAARRDKQQEQKDVLFSFKLSVESIIRIVKDQTNKIQSYCDSIAANDIYPPELSFLPMYGLKRISDGGSFDRIFVAYIRRFPGKHDIKGFDALISDIDYFLSQFLVLPDEIRLTMNYDHERKKEFGKVYKKAHTLLSDWMLINDPMLSNTPLGRQFAVVLDEMTANRTDNYDIAYYDQYFFKPINDIAVASLPGTAIDLRIVELANLTRDGKQLLSEIQAQNRVSKSKMEELLPRLSPAIAKLEQHAVKILALS